MPLFAQFYLLSSTCPKSFLLQIKPTDLKKRLFPSSFQSVIISSLHGWLILSFQPSLNRCLDSSDSLQFPTLSFRGFSSLFKKTHKSSSIWSSWCDKPELGPHHKVVHVPPSFHTHECNFFHISDFKANIHTAEKRGKLSPFVTSHFSEQVMFPFISIHIEFSQKVSERQVSHTVYHIPKFPVPFIYSHHYTPHLRDYLF